MCASNPPSHLSDDLWLIMDESTYLKFNEKRGINKAKPTAN
jgi:hypothetical protein